MYYKWDEAERGGKVNISTPNVGGHYRETITGSLTELSWNNPREVGIVNFYSLETNNQTIPNVNGRQLLRILWAYDIKNYQVTLRCYTLLESMRRLR